MASRRRGKIPTSEWKAIAARRKAGEPLVQIARDYGCTGPAIGYIVNRVASRGGASTPMQTDPAVEGRAWKGAHPAQAPLSEGQHAGTTSLMSPSVPVVAQSARSRVTGLDSAARERITHDIAAFLYALDAVDREPSHENMDQLRQDTDHLMRAAAQVRIELERSSDN